MSCTRPSFFFLFAAMLSAQAIWSQSETQGENPYVREIFELPDGPTGNSVNCIAQDPQGFLWFGSHTGVYRYDGYRFKHYTAEPGDSTSLVFSYVEYLCWTSDEMLWVGTYGGGLFRFDPRTEIFTRYQHHADDPTSLSDDRITYLMEDSKAQLWIGTVNGLNKMDRASGTFTRYGMRESGQTSLKNPDVRCIYEDHQGTIWIGTGFVYDGSTSPLGLLRRSNGGLHEFLPATGTFRSYLEDGEGLYGLRGTPVKAIFEDRNGRLWVGSLKGFYLVDRVAGSVKLMQFDPARPDEIHAPGMRDGEPGIVHSMLEDLTGNLWVFTLHIETGRGSAARIDLQSGRMETIWVQEDFAPWSTMQARDGSIWMSGAGLTGQVNKISRRSSFIRYLPASLGFDAATRDRTYDGLIFQSDSIVWVKYHTAPDGLMVLRQFEARSFGAWQDIPFPEFQLKAPGSIQTAFITNKFVVKEGIGLVVDASGDIWGCTGDRAGGIFRFDPGTREITQYLHDPENPNSPTCNTIFHLTVDRHGYIWLAGRDAISKFNPADGKYVHYRHDPDDPNTPSRGPKAFLFEDREGFIWIGGSTGIEEEKAVDDSPTLNRLDPKNGDVRRIFFPSHYQQVPITAISQNPVGDILFVMLGSGLGVIFDWHLRNEDTNVDLWSRYGGQLFSDVNNLITDANGIHWLTHHQINGSGNSIVRLDSETGSVIEFLNKDNRVFHEHRAFKAGNNLYFQDAHGLVAIATTDYLNQNAPAHQTVVRFTEFLMNGKPVEPGEESLLKKPIWETSTLKIPFTQNTFGLRFSVFDYRSIFNCKYDVRLLPLQDAWQRIEGEPIVSYYHLPPGSYTFEVRGSDSQGIWSQEPGSIQIRVAPPWWKSSIAILIYGLLSVAGIWIFSRWRGHERRKREVIKEKEMETRRLRELDAIKSQLYTNITHEFRTPLTTILGMTERVSSNPEKWFREGIEMIGRNGKYLLNLVNQMLDLNKLESGKMEVHAEYGEITGYLRYVIDAFQGMADAQGVRIHFLYNRQIMMNYDPDKILQILSNLLSNALKFTPAGGDVYITANAIAEGQSLQIEVRDTGSGIPEEKLHRIFDRFYQVEEDINKKLPGSGVGLSLAQQLVHLLNGEINVESEVGKGTRFTVLLPITTNQFEHVDLTAAGARKMPEVYIPVTPVVSYDAEIIPGEELPLCLVIEDNADVQRYIRSCLEADYRLLHSVNGTVGMVEAFNSIPDVIICDVMMPEMDGFEVCKALKTDMRTSHIPIILLTAKTNTDAKITGLSHGADAYLTKPFHETELKTRMTKLIELRVRLQAKYSSMTAENLTENKLLSLDERFMLRIRQYVGEHISEEAFGITELCAEMSISRMQLHRKLKALTNKSASHVIRAIRLEKGQELLRTTELSISEIAYQVGFRNPSYFTECFVDHFEETPTEFRTH